jgi:hypothetical protein
MPHIYHHVHKAAWQGDCKIIRESFAKVISLILKTFVGKRLSLTTF